MVKILDLFFYILTIFVSIGIVIYWKRKSNVKIKFFLIAGLIWFISVLLKIPPALPISSFHQFLRENLPLFLSEPIAWLYTGLLTGIFECGIVLLCLFIFKTLKEMNLKESIAFGLGFGVTEALLVILPSLIFTLFLITSPEIIPPKLKLEPEFAKSIFSTPLPFVERTFAIIIHLFSKLLVIYSFKTRKWKYFWISFWYKTKIDTFASSLHLTIGYFNITIKGIWLFEFYMFLFALLGIIGTKEIINKWKKNLIEI